MALNRWRLARVKHTNNALDRVEAAKRHMHRVADNSRTLSEKLNLLAGRKMTRESFKSSLDRLFPVSKDSKGDNLGQGREITCLPTSSGFMNRTTATRCRK